VIEAILDMSVTSSWISGLVARLQGQEFRGTPGLCCKGVAAFRGASPPHGCPPMVERRSGLPQLLLDVLHAGAISSLNASLLVARSRGALLDAAFELIVRVTQTADRCDFRCETTAGQAWERR